MNHKKELLRSLWVGPQKLREMTLCSVAEPPRVVGLESRLYPKAPK